MAQTILLVDYEPRTVARVTEALASLSCQIITAKDVDAAVGACARVEPRVVLITSVLPKVKVEDAITQVRARAGLRNTPFLVLMSGYQGTNPKSDAAHLGAQDIVAKPFSADDLLTRVQAALQAPRGPVQQDSKADVLEALRRSAGLKPDKGTLTSEDLFGDLIGDGDEDKQPAAETQRIAVEPVRKPTAPPAPPPAPPPVLQRSAAETQRVPLDLVLQAADLRSQGPKREKPAAKPAPTSRPDADSVVSSSLSGMLDHPARPTRVREDTGGASVDELLHQTLSGLETGLPKRKPAAPRAAAPAPSAPATATPPPVPPPASREPAREPLATTAAAVGTLFGQYELMEVISTGGMAEVFKARMKGVEGFQKIVAIKRILPHLTENDEFVTMFIDEAKLAAQLQHPNIIHIYDLGKIERSYYIAMEYIDGKDLRSLLRGLEEKKQRLPLGMALYIASRLAAALDYAHRKRDFQGRAMALVHRDVSPQNVLISLDGDIKLCDFGIAKAASKASHTRAGALKGKLQYMSPEQAWGKDLDHRSDIFSLGLVLYEMVTGRKAFAGDSELSILEQVRSPKLATPREVDPSVPAEVDRIVLRALDANREARYQTAAELGSDLDAVLRTIRPTPASAELGTYLAHLVGRDRTGALPAAEDTAPPAKRGQARPEPAPEAPPRKAAQAPPAAAVPAAPVAQPEVAQPVRAKKPLPMGAMGAAAALVLAIAVGVVVMTRERPSAPAAGEVAATPAPETVEMARQIAQQEVNRREGEMRERLTREMLTATPAPDRPAAATAVPRPTAPAPQATQVPAAVAPTEVPPPQAEPQPVVAEPVPAQPEPAPVPTLPLPTRVPAATAAQPAVQRGDLVSVADTDVEAIFTPKAAYPPLARRQRVGGVVVLRALIDENGTVQEVQVLRGVKPDLGLDAAATSAVREWRFRPATKGGVPVKLWKTITIPFQP
jgi:TonB family protein